jgi:hypothetical protein
LTLPASSTMNPNPGLCTDFNRYAANLDRLLPRRSRKGDQAAHFLHSALAELSELHLDAAQELQDFLADCEDFHRRQFQVDPDYVNHDDGGCWLPLIIVGKAWTEAASRLLEIDLPEVIGQAHRIVLKPAARTGPFTIATLIRAETSGVSEATYNRFVSQVKSVFPRLESVYDPDTLKLEVRRGNQVRVDIDDPTSHQLPSNGGVPQWLETLLQLNAVESLEINYPLRTRDLSTIADFVCAACIIPECPLDWRTKDRFPAQAALGLISDALGQGPDDPFHLCVTAVQHEWLPLVDAVVQKLSIPQRTAPQVEPGEAEANSLSTALASRAITLHPGIDLRDDNDYPALHRIYQVQGQDSPVLLPLPILAAQPSEILDSLTTRLNDSNYLRSWALHFRARARQAIDALSGGAPEPAPRQLRGVSADFLVRVQASVKDFAACILASLEKALGVVIAVEGGIASSRSSKHRFERICTDAAVDESPSDLQSLAVISEAIRLTIDSGSSSTRSRALASLVYLLMEDDVVPDTEKQGRMDDLLVFATFIAGDHGTEAIEEVKHWARTYLARIDGLAGRAIQARVSRRYELLVERIEAALSARAPNRPPSPERKPGRKQAQ